jgi:hypothetical protein
VFERWKKNSDGAGATGDGTDRDALTPTGDLGDDPQAPKGRPTPRRSDHAKQRIYERPPSSRKEAAMLQRQRKNEQKQVVQAGMDRGDEKFMLARDRGPAREYARTYIDSRLNVGTLLMPMALVVLISMIVGITGVYAILNTVWLGMMIMAAIDWTMSSVKVSRVVKRDFPKEKRGFGLTWYVVQRSLIPRRWRQPKPQVAIGTKID